MARIVCISKEGLELEETDEEKTTREAEATEFAELCSTVKDALGDKVERVELNFRFSLRPRYWSIRLVIQYV